MKLLLKKKFFLWLFSFHLLLFSQGWGYTIHEQMVQDLDVIKSQLLVNYAPLEWKKEYLHLDIKEAYQQAKEKIEEQKPSTAQQYHQIVNQFLGSLKDYHVRVNYFATEFSFFPIKVKKINEQFCFSDLSFLNLSSQEIQLLAISSAQVTQINELRKKISVGDSILEFNGVPIKRGVESLIDENFNGDRSLTGYELAVRNLFFRKASLGQKVPKGTFKVKIRSHQTGKIAILTLPWLSAPELVYDHFLKDRSDFQASTAKLASHSSSNNVINNISELMKKDYSVHLAKELNWRQVSDIFFDKIAFDFEKNYNKDNRVKGFLPPLGEITWQTRFNKSGLYAYLYKDPVTGEENGYPYLPTFGLSHEDAELYIVELEQVLTKFHQEANGLVLDITNNTGGSLLFMYAVLSLLTDIPLQLPTEREILTQQKVLQQAQLHRSLADSFIENQFFANPTLSGYEYNEKLRLQLRQHAEEIIETWKQGEVFTPPLYAMGIDTIEPNRSCQFTKPILVLVNAYCFSCADFFPAILQDNGRAVIFGEKTAGAGGYVLPYFHSSRFGVSSYSLTGSLAYRSNGLPIENLGVTPDIPYSLKKKDLIENYQPYIQQVNAAMQQLL